MSLTGVKPKALNTFPEMLEVESFYKDMFNTCYTDFTKIELYCRLHAMSDEEVLESFKIMNLISSKVK